MDVNQYVQARDYLQSIMAENIEVYITGVWDVFNKHHIIKETVSILKEAVSKEFPDIPSNELPNCRIRVFEEYGEIEAGIQQYHNTQYGLTYLGTTNIEDELFDLYYRGSYDPQFDYRFIVRYGHGEDDFLTGTKTAEAEYYLGQRTPLSMAYGIAIEDGFIG